MEAKAFSYDYFSGGWHADSWRPPREERGLLVLLGRLEVPLAQPLALREHGADGVADQLAREVVVAGAAALAPPALVALRVEVPALVGVARRAGRGPRRLEADLARLGAAHGVLVQRRELALVRRGAALAVRAAGRGAAALHEQRRAGRAGVVAPRQADGHGRAGRRAAGHLHHAAGLVLAAAGDGAAGVAAGAGGAAGGGVRLGPVPAARRAGQRGAALGRGAGGRGALGAAGPGGLAALGVHAPAGGGVALHALEAALGVAARDVAAAGRLAGLAGRELGDGARVLAGRRHHRGHALRPATCDRLTTNIFCTYVCFYNRNPRKSFQYCQYVARTMDGIWLIDEP